VWQHEEAENESDEIIDRYNARTRQKFGVKVTDMSERGVRAIGFLGGVGRKMAVPITLKIPLQIAEGANRRRKLVLTPVFVTCDFVTCERWTCMHS
jgi:hypothetical protein